MTDRFSFSVDSRDGAARLGKITMIRGEIRTPAFMPVGTAGTVKAMHPKEVLETGADILLGNTYHLMLRPTAERIHGLGGLHRFMNWQKPILTDSGGFQVWSLAALRKMTEDGVTFKSHIDGASVYLSPERSMEIQRLLGSDIVMAFDECTPFPATYDQAEQSMMVSMRWAQRSRAAFDKGGDHAERSALFGIVQGGTYEDLRHRSIKALETIGFDGIALGGLAVGEGQEKMFQVLDFTLPAMPVDKPRYLMGVGKPDDIVGAVRRGVDMFDCVLPSRSGRTGQAFTWTGPVNIRNASHKDDARPLLDGCRCDACQHYSRAYLHHLFKAGEILAAMLLTQHNLTFFQDLMQGLRKAIAEETLEAFEAKFLQEYYSGRSVGP